VKKVWVEVRRGEVIEISGIRSVSAGETCSDVAEGKSLYIKYVGDRNKTRIPFKTIVDKWAGYAKLNEALKELNEGQKK
jgi:hypothetical protein